MERVLSSLSSLDKRFESHPLCKNNNCPGLSPGFHLMTDRFKSPVEKPNKFGIYGSAIHIWCMLDYFLFLRRKSISKTLAINTTKLPEINTHFNRVKTPANLSITIVVCGYLAITMEAILFSMKSNAVPKTGTRFSNPHLLLWRFAFLNSQLMEVTRNIR